MKEYSKGILYCPAIVLAEVKTMEVFIMKNNNDSFNSWIRENGYEDLFNEISHWDLAAEKRKVQAQTQHDIDIVNSMTNRLLREGEELMSKPKKKPGFFDGLFGF